MIYLPIDDINNYSCYSVIDKDTIRLYVDEPVLNGNSDYIDFYINSHYLSKTGNETFLSLSDYQSINNITNNIYYRNDMPDILLMFLIICIFAFYLPFKIVLRWFKKL